MSDLPELQFEHFMAFNEMRTFCEALAASRPELVELGSLGTSREGRDLILLTITNPATGLAGDKPGYLIHGNIHAMELSGTHAALYTARQLLADHAPGGVLDQVAFYIIPRINPDGAEFAVTTSGSVRSRTDRSARRPNTLYQEDVNGDGLILKMRQQDPNGSSALDPEDARLLVKRRRDSKPPFYRILPEGMINDWDGSANIAIEGRGFDWNRNWSYDWRPEPEQGGAGDFPFSETEMHALAEFLHAHRNLFGVLGYHNGPEAVLRPPSTGADTNLDAADVLAMEELAQFGADCTGFPVIPVVKYHRKGQRDINLRGHFHNFGYHHLGLYVFEFELGNLMNSAGMSTEDIFNVTSDAEYEALARRMLTWVDDQDEALQREIFMPWQSFQHPQLGPLEIGGTVGRQTTNPTLQNLRRIVEGTYCFTLEHAARHPSVVLEETVVESVGGDVYRIRARVANRGQYPTHVSNRGRRLRRLEPTRVEFTPADGVACLSYEGHHSLGHMQGPSGGRLLEWFVQAPNTAETLCEIHVLGGTGGNSSVSVARPR